VILQAQRTGHKKRWGSRGSDSASRGTGAQTFFVDVAARVGGASLPSAVGHEAQGSVNLELCCRSVDRSMLHNPSGSPFPHFALRRENQFRCSDLISSR
jgi:hypothetical protein